jgi:hypothetical protein
MFSGEELLVGEKKDNPEGPEGYEGSTTKDSNSTNN